MLEQKEPSRKEIWKMFDQISPTYDSINRVMTFGFDQLWRKKVCRLLPEGKPLKILDCATGTGDQIIALCESRLQVASVVGIDLAQEMLTIGEQKMEKKPYRDKVSFLCASALEIPFPKSRFDAVTISFGIRNVTDVSCALKECNRVLKAKGKLLILEGTVPKQKGLKALRLFYLRKCLPWIGGFISKKKEAYQYLNETIETFPQGKAFCALMRKAGFKKVKAHPIWGGALTLYEGEK